MEPDSIVDYRGHEIRIVVIAPTDERNPSYRATYEILRPGSATHRSGTVAGAFLSAQEATDQAVRAAKRAIDERITD